ncbi:reverse gyrase [Metallosphaera javensis (ex Sakai et al. 2022)]|uniref:reverse gyrase n=1 Tax=Metallosphaera javensis (ex Sakai et al. 2022) TaxID=2775498 RepID=UPI002582C0E1
MITSVFHSSCPNCQGPLEDYRALAGLPCSACMPGSVDSFKDLPQEEKIRVVYNILVNNGKLGKYWELYYTTEMYNEIINYFKHATGNEPWSLQRLWLRRLGERENFSLSAPTGMGKTTTLISYSTYLSKAVLYIVPTKSLQEQICSKIGAISSVSCGKVDPNSISVLTVSYVNKNYEQIRDYRPNFIAVDDADAIIKSGKTTDKLVELMGIPKDVYEDAMRLVRLRRMLYLKDNKDEIMEKIALLERKIQSFTGIIAQLVVASATLRPKGVKQKALRHISGFDISTAQTYARNIVDSFTSTSLEEVVQRLGPGGLILVSREYGKEKMKEIKETLTSMNFKVGLAISGRKFLQDFSDGKTDILVGSASYYGVAVRGIDEPKRLKYVLFYGVPKSRTRAEESVKNPFTLLRVSRLLGIQVPEEEILGLSPAEAQAIKIAMITGQPLEGRLGTLLEKMKVLVKEAQEALKKVNGTIVGETFQISRKGKEVFIEYPDIITYLQGSGRSSRLLNGGLTQGLSVILVDDQVIFELFKRKMNFLIPGFAPVNFETVELDKVKEEIERTRREGGNRIEIKTGLLVVESPTKAKTISRLFGFPARRSIGGVPVYETVVVEGNRVYILDVMATKGHVTDLTLEEKGYYGVEIKGDRLSPFYSHIYRCSSCKRSVSKEVETCPYCGSNLISSSLSTINAMRKLALEVDQVFIATDPDTEGEKIAFDVAINISPYNPNIARIKYHEVTRSGIVEALRTSSSLDMNVVYSQMVRRIEDRWIGFELSKLLKLRFGDRNHGAGRVQTPVLGWIVKKTVDYKQRMGWILNVKVGSYVYREFHREKPNLQDKTVEVDVVEEREETLQPPPPFSTDDLLIEAYRWYKIPAERVMRLAQDLFESGLITYHRTDSHHVSGRGMEIAKEYLEKTNLSHEYQPRGWGSEGTHEAIRPTRPLDLESLKREIAENPTMLSVKFSWAHFALYDMIFRRFMASQMRESKGVVRKFRMKLGERTWDAELLVKMYGGFSNLYTYRLYDVPVGKTSAEISVVRGSDVRLLTYADVIKDMKEKRIGRPSTYAKTIQSLLRHGYVIESKKKAVLVATKKGINAYEFLSRFPDLTSEEVTADLLSKMDAISTGSLEPTSVLLPILHNLQGLETLPKSEQEI